MLDLTDQAIAVLLVSLRIAPTLAFAYLALIAEGARASGTRCLAWCLMDNHVHAILVPPREDDLRAMLGEAHRRYSRRINFREGWRGYLF